MRTRLFIAVLFSAFAGLASPLCAQTVPSTFVPIVPNTFSVSIVRAGDGNVWFSGIAYPNGQFAYFGRLTPAGRLNYYPAPLRIVGGRLQAALPFRIADMTTGNRLGSRSLVFGWAAYDPQSELSDESGLGSLNLDQPTQIREYGAGQSGDPLFESNLSLEVNVSLFGLATTLSPPRVWTYAHATPTASSSPEEVAGFHYPLGTSAGSQAFRVGAETYGTYEVYSSLARGDDGNLWFVDYADSAIGRVDGTGAHEYPIGMQAWSIADGLDAHLWVAGLLPGAAAIERVSLTGSVDGTAVMPPIHFDFEQPIAAGVNGLWSVSTDWTLGLIYFLHLSEMGQWSWYATPSPFGTATAAFMGGEVVAADGTVWESIRGYTSGGVESGLIGYKPSRFLSAQPLQLSLTDASSPPVAVTVSETQVGGTSFASAIPDGCPLSVHQTAPNRFLVTATAAIPSYDRCGITVSDGTGISVWVPATSSATASASEDARRIAASSRARLIEQFSSRPLGRQ